MEIFFSVNNQNNHVCINYSDGFLGMCDPPDVEPDDIPEANSQNSFAIGVVENKENIEIFPTSSPANEEFKLDLKLHMVEEIMNLPYQLVVYFVKVHIYWLENVMNFMGPSQKINQRHFISNTLS